MIEQEICVIYPQNRRVFYEYVTIQFKIHIDL